MRHRVLTSLAGAVSVLLGVPASAGLDRGRDVRPQQVSEFLVIAVVDSAGGRPLQNAEVTDLVSGQRQIGFRVSERAIDRSVSMTGSAGALTSNISPAGP